MIESYIMSAFRYALAFCIMETVRLNEKLKSRKSKKICSERLV